VGGGGGVGWVPPDRVLGGRLTDEELVLRRSAGVLARHRGQGATGDDRRLAVSNSVLVQLGGGEIVPGPDGLSDADMMEDGLFYQLHHAPRSYWPAGRAGCRAPTRPSWDVVGLAPARPPTP